MAGLGPGLGLGGGYERFKCLAETITTYANGKIPSQTGANHPSTCSTIAPTKAFGTPEPKEELKKSISMAWCQGRPPLSGQHYGYSQFWNSPAGGGAGNTNWNEMQTFFEVDRHGVTMKLQPYGFDAAHHLPTPTACRSGDVANAVLPISKKYHIANTYVATFVDSNGAWNTAKKILRHGVLGYKEEDGFDATQKQNHQNGVRDQAIALVDAFHFSRVVSLNVMNAGQSFTKGQREILRAVENVVNSATVPATVPPTASRGPGTLNVAMATYGVNFLGRFTFQKTTYSENIEAFQTMVDMVMEEVTQQMDPNYLRLPSNSATFTMPDACEKTYKTLLRMPIVAVNAAIASLQFNKTATHTIGNEFDRIKQALHVALQHGGALQNQGRRNALKCVLTQVQEIFSNTPNSHLNTAVNGAKAPGATRDRRRDNVVRAIEVLNALIYGGKSFALHRSGDVVRMAAFSSFLGVDVWVNCKSGLDRTGGVTPLVSAFTMMVLSMESTGAGTLASTCPDTLMYIAVNWESILKSSTANALVDSYATDPTSNPPLRVCATGLNVDHKSDAEMLAVMQDHGAQLIAQLRSLTLKILLKTSVPITYLSTGVIGLKWAGAKKKLALGSAPTMGYLLPSRFMSGRVGPFDLHWLTDNSDRRGS